MKNTLFVAMAALSVFGVVACTVAAPPATSGDRNSNDDEQDDSEQASTTKKKSDTAKTSSSSSSSSGSSGSSPEGGAGGDDTGACGTLNGSCRTASVCNEYRGGSADIQKKTCDTLKGTWSDDACDTTESVGGCKTETRVAGTCSSGTSWMFAPVTADDVAPNCAAPGVVVQPGDSEE